MEQGVEENDIGLEPLLLDGIGGATDFFFFVQVDRFLEHDSIREIDDATFFQDWLMMCGPGLCAFSRGVGIRIGGD